MNDIFFKKYNMEALRASVSCYHSLPPVGATHQPGATYMEALRASNENRWQWKTYSVQFCSNIFAIISLSASISSGQTNFPCAMPGFRWHLQFSSFLVSAIRFFKASNIITTFANCASENASSKTTHLSRFVITHLCFKAGRHSVCRIIYHTSARISACQLSPKEHHHVSVYRKFV